jgi:hypothetical protein
MALAVMGEMHCIFAQQSVKIAGAAPIFAGPQSKTPTLRRYAEELF